ncbi:hypothetical protein Fmac_013723 [Flemingia macrophylla]|uniref:Ycf15 n=1 Tax=Flemingia macrophylla TaxID=520843 RepID=A0ABD1MTZ1_9FABA
MIALPHDYYFQGLHQKTEVEKKKKLSTSSFQEGASPESGVFCKRSFGTMNRFSLNLNASFYWDCSVARTLHE